MLCASLERPVPLATVYPEVNRSQRRRRTLLGAAGFVGLMTTVSCADRAQPLEPGADAPASAVIMAGKPTQSSISAIDLGAATFEIEGSAATVTVTVTNAGKASLKEVAVRAHVVQGAASRALGQLLVTCANSAPGIVPAGATCATQLTVAVTNSAAGTGTLSAGAAQFQTALLQVGGRKEAVLDSRSDAVSLVANSPPSDAPYIADLAVAATDFVIDGTGVAYTIAIQNPGAARSNVYVQAVVTQGATERAAGGTNVMCPVPDGQLPAGMCEFVWFANASNTAAGSGVLVAGPAELVVFIGQNTEVFDTVTASITLIPSEPAEPYILSLELTSTTFNIGGPGVPYEVTFRNPTQALYDGMTVRAVIRQGTTFRAADDFDFICGQGKGVLPPGDCTRYSTFRAQNENGGDGILEPGAATLEFALRASGSVLDAVIVPITLEW